MGWYALENIEYALQDSKKVLLPVEFKVWTVFAVIILLTGHIGTGIPTFPFSGTDSGSTDELEISSNIDTELFETGEYQFQNIFSEAPPFDEITGEFSSSPGSNLGLILLIILIPGLLLFLVFVSSIFEFVMFKSVKEAKPRLAYAKEFLTEGLQYFTFRLGFYLVLGASIITAVALLSINLAHAIIVIPTLLVILGVLYGISWVVIHLAIPIMIYQEQNLAEALYQSFKIIKHNIEQVALFWLIKWVISLTLSFIASIVVLSMFFTLLIPFFLVSVILAIITPLLVIPLVLTFGLIMFGVVLYISVPVRVYLYNYILNVYEDLV